MHKVFSKRKKGNPGRLIYNRLPEALRIQMRMIVAGFYPTVLKRDSLSSVELALRKEHPLPSFALTYGDAANPTWVQFIARGTTDEVLDTIELVFRQINGESRDPSPFSRLLSQLPDPPIRELNARFLEHSIGYQFSVEQNQLIKLESSHMHEEAVAPAIRLLHQKGFEGPSQEYAEAHKHYRAGNGKDALAWAVKALESTAKAICKARGWQYDPKAALKGMLDVLFTNGLVPKSLEGHFGALRSALESGLPTIGNSMARHGQGPDVNRIGDHMVTFGMHQAAAGIVFLVEAHKALS